MITLRTLARDDIDTLYEIALATGDSGKDASKLYKDPKLIGHIYAAPYAVLTPQTCIVAEDNEGVVGYVVGVFDTRTFEAELERSWWPDLRQICPDPGATPQPHWTVDDKRCAQIHHPQPIPQSVVSKFPAHMHMNLFPRAQGQGIGRKLCENWLDLARENGVTGVHVGVSPLNRGGAAFWQKCGFRKPPNLDLPREDRAVWLGQYLDG